MGYRARLFQVSKQTYNEIKSLSKDELSRLYNINKNDSFYPPDISEKTLYELGDFDISYFSFYKNFFEKDCINSSIDDFDFKIVDKEFLAQIINTYKSRVSNYYNSMLNPFLGNSEFEDSIKTIYGEKEISYDFDEHKLTSKQKSKILTMINYLKSLRMEWTGGLIYDLSSTEKVTESWKFEYSIFEIIRIYKTFDWDKKVMVYFGG